MRKTYSNKNKRSNKNKTMKKQGGGVLDDASNFLKKMNPFNGKDASQSTSNKEQDATQSSQNNDKINKLKTVLVDKVQLTIDKLKTLKDNIANSTSQNVHVVSQLGQGFLKQGKDIYHTFQDDFTNELKKLDNPYMNHDKK
jgi:transcription initiation factor IIF auxiliary subunit